MRQSLVGDAGCVNPPKCPKWSNAVDLGVRRSVPSDGQDYLTAVQFRSAGEPPTPRRLAAGVPAGAEGAFSWPGSA